jgi:beta-1,4-N-acetylglucosaminyltransferase
MKRRLKICVVSSIGGHLDEVMKIFPLIHEHENFFVVNAEGPLPKAIEGKTIRITHSERDWKLILNFYEAFKILCRSRPDVIISTGAGPAVPFSIAGKIFGAKILFIETFTAVSQPTLTGRIMYRIADKFIYQWEALRFFYPKGEYAGTIY